VYVQYIIQAESPGPQVEELCIDDGSMSRDSNHPEAGLVTSDFYKTKNIPENSRFNHPDWFEGYNTKQHHPFYQTSANVHG